MNRLIITLCLMSRVWSAVTIQRHIYSHQISRMARTDPTSSSLIGRSYSKFGDNPGKFDIFAHTEQNNYNLKDPTEFKSAEKLRSDSEIEADLNFKKAVTEGYKPLPFTPVTKYNYNYKKPRNIETADIVTGFAGDKINTKNAINDEYYGYDNDFPNDEEDVKTSGRNTYENYASFFYHNPYEVYDRNSIDMDKAKDKRYADLSEKVIPVHENIENDITFTPTYEVSTPPYDNPIGGHGPFFSFVLNDYFDRNHDEDTLSFKGLGVDWGRDFDHDTYASPDETKRDRRLEHYFTPMRQWLTTPRPVSIPNQFRSVDQSVTEKTHNNNLGYNKHDVGERKHSTFTNKDGNVQHKYDGFKDFLDTFANKFGLAENNGDSNYVHEINKDKGEKKNGFHRVYHKDEFLEDKEFFDRSNSSQKAADKASSKFKNGGSEAVLRSQAFGASNEAANANSNFRNDNNDNHENSIRGDSNTILHHFDKYINVAKQAARSNNADYLEE